MSGTSSVHPGAASFFSLDEAIVYQPITHSCQYCKGLVFNTRPTEIAHPRAAELGRFDFKQDFDLGDALHLARDVDCPLFKTFFNAEALSEEYKQTEHYQYPNKDEYADGEEKLLFHAKLRYSHQCSPDSKSNPPLVRVRHGVGGSLYSTQISDLIEAGGPHYALHRDESSSGGDCSRFWFPKAPQLSFGTKQFLHQLRDELETCCRTHEACGIVSVTTLARPKRLLKLDIGNESCQVVAADDEVEYAALSYCWGKTQAVLTTDTLPALQSGVHPSYFSRTIQDALKVVASFGFQHLWVDAVCILQDDPRDKTEEIQKMGSIYHGATFTIAAANSATSQEGFLTGCLRDAYSVSLEDENRKTDLMMIMYPEYLQDEPAHPLHTRAWTLQEAYFSRRYLHFGPYSVAMVCSTSFDFSCDFWGVETIFRNRDKPAKPHFDVWRTAVENYSHRKLTLPSDKLVAISAIARDVANALEDPRPENYLAGLWRQHLAYDLLWSMEDPPQPRPPYRAPSWSWASVDGKVNIQTKSNYECKELVIVDAVTSWDDSVGPFSSVTGGFIVVSGRIRATSDYVVTSEFQIEILGILGCLDAIELEMSPARQQGPDIWVLEGLRVDFEANTGYSMWDVEDIVNLFGLILLENPDGQSFTRIGSFHTTEHIHPKFWDTAEIRTIKII